MRDEKKVCWFLAVVYVLLAIGGSLFGHWAFGAELKLFDAMRFTNKPISEKLGCIHFPGLYQWELHGGGQIPNEELDFTKPAGKYYVEFAQKVRGEGTTAAWLNLEAWNFNSGLGPAVAEKRMRNKLMTLALFRAAAPSVQWQVYNWTVDDQTPYWLLAIDRMSVDRWWKWHDWNERYAKPVLEAQHSIFPDCYLRRNFNDKQWQRTEGSIIREVQRLVPGKAIYPVLRFRYDSATSWVPPKRMRMAMEYLRDLGVNGFMFWSPGWQGYDVPWTTPEVQALWNVIREVVARE